VQSNHQTFKLITKIRKNINF